MAISMVICKVDDTLAFSVDCFVMSPSKPEIYSPNISDLFDFDALLK